MVKDDDVRNYRDSVRSFVERAKESAGLDEVAARFARNIANGRWLWRNRTIARTVCVDVARIDAEGRAEPLARFDALATPLNHFDAITDDERSVATVLIEIQDKDDQLSC